MFFVVGSSHPSSSDYRVCDGRCTHTHLLHAHFSAHSACTVTSAHLHACANTRMAQVSEKVFAVCMFLLSISPSPFSCLTHLCCSLTVTSRPFPTLTSITFLPSLPVLKAQDMRISARVPLTPRTTRNTPDESSEDTLAERNFRSHQINKFDERPQISDFSNRRNEADKVELDARTSITDWISYLENELQKRGLLRLAKLQKEAMIWILEIENAQSLDALYVSTIIPGVTDTDFETFESKISEGSVVGGVLLSLWFQKSRQRAVSWRWLVQ